jgi:hypothetical protein
MCPVCATTTLAWITAGATSMGGITTLVVNRLRSKNNRNKESDIDKNQEGETWSTGKRSSR